MPNILLIKIQSFSLTQKPLHSIENELIDDGDDDNDGGDDDNDDNDGGDDGDDYNDGGENDDNVYNGGDNYGDGGENDHTWTKACSRTRLDSARRSRAGVT